MSEICQEGEHYYRDSNRYAFRVCTICIIILTEIVRIPWFLFTLADCKILGNPVWNCNYSDFLYLNRYPYIFESFVFTKASL